MPNITYIDEVEITNKRILLRVDFNVSLTPDGITIADDARMRQALPTIEYLLKNNNKLILVSHLGRPKGREIKYSLKIVADHLQKLLPGQSIELIPDFTNGQALPNKNIVILENIRFYPEEKAGDMEFAKKLAGLAEIYVNDAFGVSHRTDSSVVGVSKFLQSYGGLLMKKEVNMLSKIIENPARPFVAIIGGAKISTKLTLIGKLTKLADNVLVGGGLANTFFCAKGLEIGVSICEHETTDSAKKLLSDCRPDAMVLPSDAVVSDGKDNESGVVYKIDAIPKDRAMFDIGPETQAKFGSIIARAKTVVWNGPVGYFENPAFRRGTDFIYYVIAENRNAVSIVGGGDTLAAISKKEYLEKITHISTGGGAMLEFIENGTLPGIEALKK